MKIIDFHTHLGISMPWVSSEEYNTTAEELITVMDENSINRACCCANPVVGKYYSYVNNYIGEQLAKYPDRLIGFCRVDPRLLLTPELDEIDPVIWEKIITRPDKRRLANSWVIREIIRCIKELNFDGIKLNPAVEIFAPDNTLFDPLYELAIDLNIPVQIHCDQVGHFTGSPQRILKVAKRFPKLRVCAIHLYSNDAIEFLKEASNIFIEISEVAKGRLITKALNYFGKQRVLFGSDYPFGDPGVILAILRELKLNDDVLDNILFKNSLALIKEKI